MLLVLACLSGHESVQLTRQLFQCYHLKSVALKGFDGIGHWRNIVQTRSIIGSPHNVLLWVMQPFPFSTELCKIVVCCNLHYQLPIGLLDIFSSLGGNLLQRNPTMAFSQILGISCDSRAERGLWRIATGFNRLDLDDHFTQIQLFFVLASVFRYTCVFCDLYIKHLSLYWFYFPWMDNATVMHLVFWYFVHLSHFSFNSSGFTSIDMT